MEFIHPEKKEDEIFVTNATLKTFAQMGWRSKRKGLVAYDGVGVMLNVGNWFPIFVKKKELQSCPSSLEKIRHLYRGTD